MDCQHSYSTNGPEPLLSPVKEEFEGFDRNSMIYERNSNATSIEGSNESNSATMVSISELLHAMGYTMHGQISGTECTLWFEKKQCGVIDGKSMASYLTSCFRACTSCIGRGGYNTIPDQGPDHPCGGQPKTPGGNKTSYSMRRVPVKAQPTQR